MKIVKKGQTDWTNRHETFTEDIHDLYELGNDDAADALDSYNNATQGFMGLIKEAITTQTPLRTLGAGWSWTKIATVKDGIMLDTKPLNTRFNITAASLRPDYTGDPKHLTFVQSGMSVQEVDDFLFSKGQAMKTHGASNGQTMAGAVSTGVHGAVFDFGAMPEFVNGLHIITGPDKHVYLERASKPVVSDGFITRIQAEHVLDDDLFNAALVSFGSFGIIQGMMIETEDLYLIDAYMQRLPYDDSDSGKNLKAIMETLDFSNAKLPCGNERPYHFMVLLNPYDMEKGAYVTTMYKRPYVSTYNKPKVNDAGIGPGDDAPTFIGLLADNISALVPTMVTKILGANLPLSDIDAQGNPIKQTGTIGEIFTNNTLRGKLLSAAVAMPISEINRVIALMLKANEDYGPFAGLFSFRFVKGSGAMLGFTKFEHSFVMELDAAYSPKAYEFYTKTWQMLEDEGIPFAFHWGKITELSPDRVRRMYGQSVDNWLNLRKQFLDAQCLELFTNPLMREWGLA